MSSATESRTPLIILAALLGNALIGAADAEPQSWVRFDHPSVQHYVKEFTQPSWRPWLRGVWERAAFFDAHIVAAVDRHGLPAELALLPVVESAFRTGAVSTRGAVGLWQLTLLGAADYPLVIDDSVDERRDFWKATEVALRTLASNFARFGDWPLAIAAYNAGVSRVQRAIAAADSSDFWHLRSIGALPGQTAEFVPRLLASVYVFEHAERYGLADPREVRWARIGTSGDRTNLRRIAEVSGVPLTLLRRANAELNSDLTPTAAPATRSVVTSGEHAAAELHGYWLKVPLQHAGAIKRALEGSDGPMFTYAEHRVRRGDTLSELALWYDSSIELIMEENRRVEPLRLRIGDTLLVPLLSDRQPGPPPPSTTPPATILRFGAVYAVAPGESLWRIARDRDTTVEALALANGRDLDGIIRPGDLLFVPHLSSRRTR